MTYAGVVVWMALVVSVFSSNEVSAAVRMTDPVRDEKGELVAMSLDQATAYCESLKGHVPSLREFALFAQSKGAQGLRETAYPNASYGGDNPGLNREVDRMTQAGFYPVLDYRRESLRVLFYYSPLGFVTPSGWDLPVFTDIVYLTFSGVDAQFQPSDATASDEVLDGVGTVCVK